MAWPENIKRAYQTKEADLQTHRLCLCLVERQGGQLCLEIKIKVHAGSRNKKCAHQIKTADLQTHCLCLCLVEWQGGQLCLKIKVHDFRVGQSRTYENMAWPENIKRAYQTKEADLQTHRLCLCLVERQGSQLRLQQLLALLRLLLQHCQLVLQSKKSINDKKFNES
jgi:hypothetical protein